MSPCYQIPADTVLSWRQNNFSNYAVDFLTIHPIWRISLCTFKHRVIVDGHFMCRLLSLMLTRLHFQRLCQQSSLASFSKTPQVLSLIRPFSVGKHHGNSAGKSLNLGYCNKHICKKRLYTHTHCCCCRVPHQCWAIDVSPMSSGPHWSELSSNQSRHTGRTFIINHSIAAAGTAAGPLKYSIQERGSEKQTRCGFFRAGFSQVARRWWFYLWISSLRTVQRTEPDDPMKVGFISFHFFLSPFKLSPGPFVMGCVL